MATPIKEWSKLEVRAVVRFLFSKGTKPSEILKQIAETHDEGAMSRSRVYQWCTWFVEGRTSLGDEPMSGRPKTSTNEENTTRVDEVIRCDRRMKIREIALKLEIPKMYNQSNCGTKVTSILTLMVSSDLHNKRLACLSYNRTYIEGFNITDISELFVVSVSNNDKAPGVHASVKALVWIVVALIIFVLAQHITNFTSSRTGEEGDSDRQRMETLIRQRIFSQIKVRKTDTQAYLAGQQIDVIHLEPAVSPDMNPIENVWDILGRHIQEMNPAPKNNNAQLIQSLTNAWSAVLQDQIFHIVNSMRRRCQDIIPAGGGNPGY
ncbi:histone-lysine N-methyltransferase SETMAR [Plakobranchus ocellatus]|uniref:Histone-lysine N-methyltransferase SETMAR n=1 Tax=Plakobranchus ocellatus TaxID=259542 RepID=A0AAV4A9N0_9GAST|nr:histone-lysine N-methyltransferase SETMAR [Plakobranchus ocellatus]